MKNKAQRRRPHAGGDFCLAAVALQSEQLFPSDLGFAPRMSGQIGVFSSQSSASDRAKFRDAFAHDVTADEASVMAATQKPLAGSAFSEPAPAPAWKEIPSWYAVSTQDNSIPPD